MRRTRPALLAALGALLGAASLAGPTRLAAQQPGDEARRRPVPAHTGAPFGPRPLPAALSVDLRGPRELTAEPGRVMTAVFVVTNGAQQRRYLGARLVLPAAWRPVAPEWEFALAGGKSDARIVSFVVPANARSGAYLVVYEASAGGAQARDSVAVLVPARRHLSVEPLETPPYVASGEPFAVRFLIANRGNSTESVSVRAECAPELLARPDSSVLVLGPGEKRVVSVIGRGAAGAGGEVRHRLALVASRTVADTMPPERGAAVIAVVPRSDRRDPDLHRLPATARVHVPDVRTGAPAFEVASAGPLVDRGATTVNLLLRGPSTRYTAFSEQDEYRVSARGPRFSVDLGDHVFGVSRVTEPGQYAFGARGRFDGARWSAEGYSFGSRRAGPRERAYGAAVERRLGQIATLGANVHARQGPHGGQIAATRVSALPYPGATLDAEYGVGRSAAGSAPAYALLYEGSHSQLSYSWSRSRAGAAYPVRPGFVNYDNASIGFDAARWLRLHAQYYAQAAGRDAAGAAAGSSAADSAGWPGWGAWPDWRVARVGAVVRGVLTLEARREERSDWSPDSAGRLREHSVAARFAPSFGRLRASAGGEFGTLARAGAPAGQFAEYTLRSAVLVGRGVSLSGYADLFTGRSIFSAGPRRRLTTGLDLAATLGGSTSAAVSAVRTREEVRVASRFAMLDARVDRRLSAGRRLTWRWRLLSGVHPAGGRAERSVSLEYAVPLGVPMGHARATGRVLVRLIDAQTNAAIPDVLVQLGERRLLTDRDGRAAFASLPPGAYHLNADLAPVGLDRVADRELPTPVHVSAGEAVSLTLQVQRAARLRGRVSVDTTPADRAAGVAPPPGATVGVAGVVIELTRDGEMRETRRLVSDARGGFAATELRPGRWRVRVVDAALPAHHRFERDATELELRPGEEATVEFEARPVSRRLRLIEGGEIRPPQAAPPPAPPQ